MNHFVSYCKWGHYHGTCRCASPNKTVKIVTCRLVAHAEDPKPLPGAEPPYVPKHRKEI